jgi:cupin 2 domain-containing protein
MLWSRSYENGDHAPQLATSMTNKSHNIYSGIPEQLPEELFDTLLQREGIKLERIVSHGHTTPPGEWYDQASDEWVILLSGSATLLFDNGDTHHLKPGDYHLIPAHCKHRVEATDEQKKSVWLALHVEQSVTVE